MRIILCDELFILDVLGVLFYLESFILFIVDFYFGKILYFWWYGFVVLVSVKVVGFWKFFEIMDIYCFFILVFLGDFFYSSINNEWNDFVWWWKSVYCEVIFVEGNYDILWVEYYLIVDI